MTVPSEPWAMESLLGRDGEEGHTRMTRVRLEVRDDSFVARMRVVVPSSQLRHVARVEGLNRRWILLTPCDCRSVTVLSHSGSVTTSARISGEQGISSAAWQCAARPLACD